MDKIRSACADPTLTFVTNGATLNLFNGFTNGSSIPRGTDINYIITGSTASKPGEEFWVGSRAKQFIRPHILPQY